MSSRIESHQRGFCIQNTSDKRLPEMTTAPKQAAQPNPTSWLDRHGDYLYRYALFRLRDPIVAEDVLQETLLAAIKGYPHFSGESSERTWLVGILRHKILDRCRELTRFRPPAETEDFNTTDFQENGNWHHDFAPVSWSAEPYALIEQKEFWTVLSHGLDSLPARMATAFVLREVDGLRTDEICEALNVSRENLWVLLHRARLSLRRFLQTNWFAPPAKPQTTRIDPSRIDGHVPIPTAVRFASEQRLTA
jgi:RNA polymerase sigma-70 factor, ECF subfamily